MRTIFFSFSAEPVWKTLFFFEGSVCEKLAAWTRQNPEARVIFVMPTGYAGKYGEGLQKHLHERCGIAHIPFIKKQTFLERSFRFFYSYFVYTGTTRIMATIGIRPDEPPGGGPFKKYLGPLKWLISRTFGRSDFFRKVFVPYFYYHVFRGRPFQELFEKYKPDLIFASNIINQFDTALVAEAKRQGVPTMGMSTNWDHYDKYYLPMQTDTLLVQSDQMKDFAIRYQWYDPKCLSLTGYPHLDFVSREGHTLSRAEVLEGLRLPPDARYIVYASSSAYCKDEPDIIEEILKWIAEKRLPQNLYVVIRPYAGVRKWDREVEEEKFDRFEGYSHARIFRGQFWGDAQKSNFSMNVLHKADVVLAVYTTMAIEAAVLGRPLIAPTFDGYAGKRPFSKSVRRFAIREHFRDVVKTGALKPAYTFDQLYTYLSEYLKDPMLDAEKRQALIERVCYLTDGNASERIFQRIQKSIL
ncbi:MAG: hypothetical protein G01um101433_722 [Parcubacteria group bacterium Gr01-1014_33]|nr:MAG: hypothetical protein G01um101433_722 [Parcubacteria group bacterium Gr01-1014_33]